MAISGKGMPDAGAVHEVRSPPDAPENQDGYRVPVRG
jgi:hypothetical protein